MNRNPIERNRSLEKPIPGCLGRMVNLFDLNTSIGGNRLLTDKPHYEGSPVSRCQSDVSRSQLVDDQINDKVIVSELGKSPSNRKSNGTPIKMLIAQEMSKEDGPKQSPPNLVAKLMGLDALPQRHQLGSASCRSNPRGPRNHSGSMDFIQKDHGFLDTRQHNHYQDQGEYKDVYEIWQQSCKTNGDLPQQGRHKQSKNDKSMALVREKFMEAKRLSTDEKHRQSKQFQDALEVLSSNKDLFLKLLQEPNSLFSQHHHLPSIPPPPDSRRITVLRPSKLVDGHKLTGSGKKNGKQINETAQTGHCNMWDKSNSRLLQAPECYKYNGNPTQPTRIVVLKPSSGKSHELKVVASPPSSLRTSNDDGFYGDPEDSETVESREVPKESTCGMSENPSSHRRDETLLSSVFSNGYIGDESSFSKSEVYYAAGNLSDSEVMSPTSRHSWDYINRFGSPYSSSSFSRASYSPESSVCREAKKRLSERWAMMALNGSVQEQRHVRRSSSTLGEMLALSDLKKSAESEELCKNREGSKASTSYLTTDLNKPEDADNSPKNLVRSKSLPVSSAASCSRLEDSEFLKGKKDDSKDLTKEKGVKSSLFKGRVSSLFFSKSRKSSKLKPHKSDDEHQSDMRSPRHVGNDGSECINDMVIEDAPGLHGSSRNASCQGSADAGLVGEHLPERGFSVTKPETRGNANENQDQPSPISVLELQYEDDCHTAACSRNAKLDDHGVDPAKFNLIDKSPPIGSIARTLSWDDPAVGPVTPVPGKTSMSPEEEEQECFLYVETLLSAAGIDGGVQSGSFSTMWHSAESPLDPRLRDTYMSLTAATDPPAAHQRRKRSIQRLVFDCVNEALMDVGGHTVVDHVWARMKEWVSGEERCVWDDIEGEEGGGSLAVERVVRKEVVGEVWVEGLRLEIENIKKEIEEKVVKEVVEECVVELTDRVVLGYNL
ncbi:hypothetical protein OSB04_020347 [Centaurea solstitialis]|uniref:Uncharacterized protein n=1 Tax=Centaurea solstitialis TaxID=347529 RepID=A0AA38WF52_9ASTR|nr:hypothetical protein OSB04_020347 [Centaurea solstitialis]